MKNFFLVFSIATLLIFVVISEAIPAAKGANDLTQASSSLLVSHNIPGNLTPDPFNIVASAPGHVWFTMPDLDAIGSLVVTDTTDFTFTTYQTTPGGEPYDLVYDPAGDLIWFTEKSGNSLGKLEISTGNIITYNLPTNISANSAPTGIDIAPNGHIWYVGENSDVIGRLNPVTETFTEWMYTTSGANFNDVAVSSDTEIWASSPSLKRLVVLRVNLSSFFIAPVNIINGPLMVPQGIDMGRPSTPWVAVPEENLAGFLSPGTLTNWNWFVLPGSPGEGPTALVYDPVGSTPAIWYVKRGSARAGRLIDYASSPFIAEFGLPAGSDPAGLAVDSQGHVWMTAPGTGQILEWRPPYFIKSYLPQIVRS